MTILEIIQEAAKRLCIIVPRTIVLADIQSKEYDADTGLLVSCLNACIKQTMSLNIFNQNIVYKNLTSENEHWRDYLDIPINVKGTADFKLRMRKFCPDFERLIGDGIAFNRRGKSYLFRQLTQNDFVRLCKMENADIKVADDYKEDYDKEIADYRRNMPSEETTYIKNSDNLESGFFVYSEGSPIQRIIYFCNNMMDMTEFGFEDVPFNLSLTYLSNYGVLSPDGWTRRDSVHTDREIEADKTNDFQSTILPDELAILGTMIKYKSYYGMDFSLDLGEQKALIDAIKENQAGIQVTHLNKKEYTINKLR
jgi:hypothetical protein